MAADHPPSAQDEPAPPNPKRVWDPVRKVWHESHTLCRRPDGPWTNKDGKTPSSQLILPFPDEDAA